MMKLFSSIHKLFSRPYPPPESFIEDMKGVVIGSIIIAAILYAFRPFGMSIYGGNIFGVALLFGAVSLVAGVIYLLLLRFLVKPMSYNSEYFFGKWVLEIMGMILFITIGNWIATAWLNEGSLNLSSFAFSLLATCLIGIIPIVIFGLQNQIKQERLNTAAAVELASRIDNQENIAATSTHLILAIQAMENYINVFTWNGVEVQKEAFRRTLKSAQEDELYQRLVKCHRSYLVNPDAIQEVKGNAQGLKLTLAHDGCPVIPVSRSYIPMVRALLA